MKITVDKRGMNIVNGNHHKNENQRKSTMIITNENRHMWNENQHGE
jgi:hypothetical protein